MPVKPLPPKSSLDHLKYQAKDLLRDHAERDMGAAQRIREFHPRFASATDAEILDARLRLADAQLVIARESGFPSWPRLKRHIEKPTLADRLDLPHHERIEDPLFRRAVELLDAGDASGLRAHLKHHPDLVRQRVLFEGGNYFRNPSLLEFVAENPIRHGKLPPKIAEIAKVIIDAGADEASLNETLGLVVTGRVVRECGVQVALINMLCDRGADPSGPVHAALHEGTEGVNALLARGARVDLPLAAGLGRIDDARRLLSSATPDERHLALALASLFGHVDVVRLLLDSGEDPNRYNPPQCHSHSTPLHQAAFAGHLKVVELLLERGARLDLKDIIWQGTPAGWAKHAGNSEIEAFLRAEETRREKTG